MKDFIRTIHKGQVDASSRMITSENFNLYLRVAKIVRVDYEKMTADLVYIDGIGSEPNVPISAAYAGSKGFLGAMPKIGDWVILGYGNSGAFSDPIIVQFFQRGYVDGVRNDILGVSPAVADIYDPERFRMQKLYEGEIYASSQYGSEIYLDKNLSLSNSRLNEIFLKAADQSMSINTLNTYINNCGLRVMSGLAHRNELINDPNYNNAHVTIPTYLLDDGTPYYTPNYSSPINDENPYGRKSMDDDFGYEGFVEHRIEVKEMSKPLMPVTSSNSGVDVDTFYSLQSDGETSNKPLVIQVLGTLIGNDPVGGKEKYGKVLKPKIFPSKAALKGTLKEEACVLESSKDEVTSLAAAYTLKFPNSDTAFYVNKQGKYFVNISSSLSSDPLGSGESVEANLKGHSKIFMGKNKDFQRSLTLLTEGGVMTNWGFDNDKNRSWEAVFQKGVSWEILAPDKEDYALDMFLQGSESRMVTGDRITQIKGNDFNTIYGKKENKILGKKTDNIIGDKSSTVGGNSTEMVTGHYSQTLSSGRSVTINAPDILSGDTVADKKDITLGDLELNMKLGNRTEKMIGGNYKTEIMAGNRDFKILAGNYKIDVTTGNVDIKTKLGLVKIKTNLGMVEIEGKLGVMVKSAISVTLDAPQVILGKKEAPKGLNVTGGPTGNHRDYLVGLPLIGAPSILSNSV